MLIKKLKLYNFRSYELFETDLAEGGTAIVGPNGTGKTNLIEAIYTTMRGNSWRGSLIDCMKLEADQTIVHLDLDSGSRRMRLERSGDKISKEFIINDKSSKILSRKNRLPIVLFEPDELRLISSSPSRRRDFLDNMIARLDDQHDSTLRSFNRTLSQRNELLKNRHPDQKMWRDNLFAWDVRFVQLAARIAQNRASFLYNNEAKLKQLYGSLAGKATDFSIEYLPSVALENYEQLLIDKLAHNRELELVTGHTSAGPQREDFLISLHNQPAIKVASRGEMRTIMLAFKLLELELQTIKSKTAPLILLDDVFSELDSTREKLLQETISQHQFIVTSTAADQKYQKVISTAS